MTKAEQINAGFRLPAELVEWLDQYATFLSDEGGFNVSRTQALLRLISLGRPKEEIRMSTFYYLKQMAEDYGFVDYLEYREFQQGAYTLIKNIKKEQGKPDADTTINEMKEFANSIIHNPEQRLKAIEAGKLIEKENNFLTNFIQANDARSFQAQHYPKLFKNEKNE